MAEVTPLSDLGVWLINLDRSDDRRVGMQTQLDTMGLGFERFSAVDGKAQWDSLQGSFDTAAFERNVGRHVMQGEIGCYHSHLGVWRALVASGKTVGLVLEDDVVFHDNFLDAMQSALSFRDIWDIVHFNKIRAQFPVTYRQIGDLRLNSYIGPLTGNGAYLIKAETAKHLLVSARDIVRPLDHELDRDFAHRIRRFGIEPFPSHVDDGNNSTITGQGFSGVKKFAFPKRLPIYFRRMLNVLRKSFHIAKLHILSRG